MKATTMKSSRRQGGFTLVEIAIVLVIVGLLLGAVLKGQELIFNTRVKATFNMSREMTAAMTSYQDRYRSLPGDDNAVAARFPAAPTLPTNGNGNGVVQRQAGNCPPNAATVGENCQFFYHLRLAGFISGSLAEAPKTPFGTLTEVAQNSQYVAGTASTPALALAQNSMTPPLMSAIDTSFDDGNPATGSVRCANTATYNLSTPDVVIAQWCAMAL